MLNILENPPAWSFSFCYYFLIGAVLAFVGVAGTALMKAKQIGAVAVAVLTISALLPLIAGMTQFWMCRASLKQYA